MFAMRVLEFGALIVLLLLAVATAQVTHPNEVRALKDIRKKLKDPMKNLNSWKRGDPCESNWTGVVCFDMPINMTLNESVPNDGYQHIKELNMLNMNLSGSLSPQIGELSYLQILDFMWNNVRGSIPKEIGNIKSLQLLVLNGNQLTGSLPEELGFLPVLRRIQIDENNISGPIPKTFANLNRTRHFHMNNNSLSGQIPSELSRLPRLVHFLLDNNNLSGPLPPEFSELPELLIMQLDNNHLDGTIPASYGNMKKLLKLSLRNCNLQGAVPDLSRIPQLGYLDLSWNRLSGPMPSNKLSENITTIDLSYNNLSGPFPANFSGLPRLQRLSLENNSFGGDVPSTIWLNRTFNGTERLQLDFQNNKLSNISDIFPPANVSIRLEGNPVCEGANQLNVIQFCKSQTGVQEVPRNSTNTEAPCSPCPQYYEYVENAPGPCFCAAPLGVGYRLKSPGFTDFLSYESQFEYYMAGGTAINLYQLSIASFAWEKGPRLEMYLKFFPEFNGMNNTFNESEIRRITGIFKEWKVPDSDIFGPYELISFILLGPYEIKILDFSESGISKDALAGIVLGVVACAIIMCAILSKVILRRCAVKQHAVTRKRLLSRASMKIDGVKDFTFKEMALATSNFNDSAEIGQGGYGKVYKGVLTDGTVVAVKRALEESLQGVKEFMTEITLLSRVHHRNLVSLIGFCDDKDEQMLVYEYMPNGTLRDCLSGEPMGFAMRLRIALASAKGILYLHTEADPPIFHRDIKTSNILLDSKFTAKVADFGLSKLAPVPDLKGATPGHVSTVAKGTPGYLDPEYFLTQKLTDKSDVYSLGVVFLELLTGMQPISHGKNIVREVYLAYNAGLIFSVVDERMGSYPSEGVERFMTLALSCCEDDTDSRPSMAHVVRELEKIWTMMPDSETEPSDSDIKEPIKGNPQSSKSATKDLYTSSSDISGSNLVSGVIPIVSPR